MPQPTWFRPGVVRLVVAVTAAVLAIVLGLVGVPGLFRLILLGALAAGVGSRLERDRWLVAGGVFFAVFGLAYVALRDSIAAFLVAAVAFAAMWWWLTPAQPLVRRLGVALVGAVVLALGALPVSLVVNNLTLPSADVDRTVAEITGSLITEHVVQPDSVQRISFFGSQEGHIYTDSSDVPRSFKHYLIHGDDCRMSGVSGGDMWQVCAAAAAQYEERLAEVVAPFDGTIRLVDAYQRDGLDDYTLMLTPTAHPNVEVTLFHMYVLAPRVEEFADRAVGLEPGPLLALYGAPYSGRTLEVRAGERLGWGIEEIAVGVAAIGVPYPLLASDGCDIRTLVGLVMRFNPQCTRETRLVSYFSLMKPDLSEDWRAWGLADLSDVVLTEDEYTRDLFQVPGLGYGGIYYGNVDAETRQRAVTELTGDRLVRAGEPFVLAEGERLLVALLEPGEIFVTTADGTGLGSFRLSPIDGGGESPAARLLSGLPAGEPLLITGETRWAAGIVASEDVRGVERLVKPNFVRPAAG